MSKASMRRRWQTVDGVLLLDKPVGLSSNDALQRARRCYQAAKAGHTGTLDPLASGLLPVLFGEATKFSHLLLDADKTYVARLRLGVTTTTGDAEGDVLDECPVTCSEAEVAAICARFVGPISQVPPMYSALKHEGKPLYEYARQGIEIERPARDVIIHAISIREIALPEVELEVRCSKGTYIRTLAEDIGKAFGCGAHLTALRRTHTGPLDVVDAVSLETLQVQQGEEGLAAALRPVDSLLAHLPSVVLDSEHARRFLHGQTLRHAGEDGQVRVYGENFLGLAVRECGALKSLRLIAQKA